MDKKWNLQDIKPAKRPARAPRHSAPMESEIRPTSHSHSEEPERVAPQQPRKSKGSGRSHILVAVVVVVLFVIIGFALSALMSGAKVNVFPRFREPVVNAAFEAKKQAAAGDLAYEVMAFEAEGERQVAATGQEQVTEQATGKLTISKNTPGSERLIKNTRFAAPNGLIFRITESAVVPGATTDSAGNTVPGTVVADVFADEAGPEYNLPAGTKFTVPGFQESNLTELYNSISAENPSAFTGGYDGPRYMIDDAQLNAALESLRSELREALRGRVASEKPSGFIVFDSSITFTYTTLPPEAVSEGQVKVKERVALKAPAFKEEDLAAYLARSVVPGYDGEPVRIENVNALTFEYVDSAIQEGDLAAAESIAFRMTGKPKLIWVFDQESLKSDLSGAQQSSLNTILGGYPAIEKASASVRPFWRRTFPDKVEDITVTESFDAE